MPLEELGRQGINTDGIKESMEVLGASFCIPPHPVNAGFIDLGLTEDLQTVLTDEFQQLAVRQAKELLFFGHLKQKKQRCYSGTKNDFTCHGVDESTSLK